ncbi:unnamed protein product [Schistocephalus solidus]|uniref:Uncharacterized protein n=1 Tax=Schistocephalus solidus TaxID=70667 RepID=A0A183T521_SCHSO|nr:unnamed protein product [Schistocephalus solidus]
MNEVGVFGEESPTWIILLGAQNRPFAGRYGGGDTRDGDTGGQVVNMEIPIVDQKLDGDKGVCLKSGTETSATTRTPDKDCRSYA